MMFYINRIDYSSEATSPENVKNIKPSEAFKVVESNESNWVRACRNVRDACMGHPSVLGSCNHVWVGQNGVERKLTALAVHLLSSSPLSQIRNPSVARPFSFTAAAVSYNHIMSRVNRTGCFEKKKICAVWISNEKHEHKRDYVHVLVNSFELSEARWLRIVEFPRAA